MENETMSMEAIRFEEEFEKFVESADYDTAENALFEVIRRSFIAGWKAAGGDESALPPVRSRSYWRYGETDSTEGAE